VTVPGTTPAPEKTELRDLVAHSLFLAAPSTVEDAQGRFRSADVDFMAVLGGDRLAGVCARRDLAQILGSRYGYALYAHRAVTDFLMSAPLELTTGMPLTDVFKATADRAHREFYDDVVLLDGEGRYVGMIPMRTIVRLQTEILMGSISALEASRLEIAGKNAQMELDLAMAREVQMAMLPRIGPGTAETGGPLGFAHRYRPAGSMSGDFFDVLELPGRSAGVLVCDVMGHGVRSA
jgi:CBS domain-containing protein